MSFSTAAPPPPPALLLPPPRYTAADVREVLNDRSALTAALPVRAPGASLNTRTEFCRQPSARSVPRQLFPQPCNRWLVLL